MNSSYVYDHRWKLNLLILSSNSELHDDFKNCKLQKDFEENISIKVFQFWINCGILWNLTARMPIRNSPSGDWSIRINSRCLLSRLYCLFICFILLTPYKLYLFDIANECINCESKSHWHSLLSAPIHKDCLTYIFIMFMVRWGRIAFVVIMSRVNMLMWATLHITNNSKGLYSNTYGRIRFKKGPSPLPKVRYRSFLSSKALVAA